MTGDRAAWVAARNEGRAATPGDRNPYSGTGIKADMWMLGYKTMLLDKLTASPARQAYLRANADQ
ncbi:hypothetical protein SEA_TRIBLETROUBLE_9 [Mycobacterium Phage TribleTrouble]|nr:hypothetical protein SEA_TRIBLETROUBLE_9 [Mycobacterium Phage TribleTrouble]